MLARACLRTCKTLGVDVFDPSPLQWVAARMHH